MGPKKVSEVLLYIVFRELEWKRSGLHKNIYFSLWPYTVSNADIYKSPHFNTQKFPQMQVKAPISKPSRYKAEIFHSLVNTTSKT